MLTSAAFGALVGHDGRPLLPHDAWTAWRFDPPIVLGIALAAALYLRGYRPARDGHRRAYAFGGGLTAVGLALLSPIDRLAGILFSAHMVQHVLLVTVAAPLIAWAAPGAALVQGIPQQSRRAVVGARRAFGVDAAALRRLRHPLARWLVFVTTFWLWHASRLYAAAVDHEWVHVAEHVTFLGTALLVWSAILGPRRARTDRGAAVLIVFLLALQGVLLSALLTFARSPWYEPYADEAPGWGLDPLADQHLAGVIMWVPTGLVHAAIGIALVVGWLREHAAPGDAGSGSVPDDLGQRGHQPALGR